MKRKGRRERKGETSIGFTGFEVNIPDPARASPQAWAVLKPCSTHSPTRHCPPPGCLDSRSPPIPGGVVRVR